MFLYMFVIRYEETQRLEHLVIMQSYYVIEIFDAIIPMYANFYIA